MQTVIYREFYVLHYDRLQKIKVHLGGLMNEIIIWKGLKKLGMRVSIDRDRRDYIENSELCRVVQRNSLRFSLN